MDLEQFVSTALTQIVRGVLSAQEKLKDTRAYVNPGLGTLPPSHGMSTVINADGSLQHLRDVEFDVALTVGDKQGADGGAGIKVFGAQLGATGSVAYENSSVSRVKFVVPLALPPAPNEAELKEMEKRREAATKVYAAFERPSA